MSLSPSTAVGSVGRLHLLSVTRFTRIRGVSSSSSFHSWRHPLAKRNTQITRILPIFSSRRIKQEARRTRDQRFWYSTTSTRSSQKHSLPHDIGGDLHSYGSVAAPDAEPLECWEQECHSTFAVLASKQILGTDELRRSIEALTPEQYDSWTYYEKWSAGMATLLLDRGIITHEELQRSLFGDVSADMATDTPVFGAGDSVRVRKFHPNQKVEWRRPHMRTPGYVYGVEGTIERVCGRHGDPSFLAFGLEAPQVQLYRVRFQTRDLWPEQYDNHHDHGTTATSEDVVEVEVYEHWLESESESVTENPVLETLFDHTSDGSDCLDHSHHDHHLDHHGHDAHEHNDHHHDHGHDHVHEPRKIVEERAAAKEGPPRPGKELFQSLRTILLSKNVISADDIRTMVERMDTAGKRLDGASLVVQAWQDPSFEERLLSDATAAASEIGISTSNPNAPTVLTVVKNTPTTHNLIVCTLCSCYPSGLLGIAPSWYKSREYRARAVREPRVVLSEDFGVAIPPSKQIRVHDSTADHRYIVLPERPLGTDGWSDERLRELVTRDTMLGVAVSHL